MNAPPAARCRLAVLVEDRPAVITRLVTTITGGGNELEALAVGPTGQAALYVQIAVRGPRTRGMAKRLQRLVHVLKVTQLPDESRHIQTIRLGVRNGQRTELMALLDMFGAQVLSVNENSLVVEAAGSPDQLAVVSRLLEPFQILDMARLPAPELPETPRLGVRPSA